MYLVRKTADNVALLTTICSVLDGLSGARFLLASVRWSINALPYNVFASCLLIGKYARMPGHIRLPIGNVIRPRTYRNP